MIFGSFPGCFKRRTTQRAKVASLTIFSSFKRRSMNNARVLLTVQRAGVKIEMSLLATNFGKISHVVRLSSDNLEIGGAWGS